MSQKEGPLRAEITMEAIFLGQNDMALHPDLPELSPKMGVFETILYSLGQMNFDKFIKMVTLLSTLRLIRTKPSTLVDLILKDPDKTPLSLLDRGHPENQQEPL